MVYSRRDIISKKQLLGQILIKRQMITPEQLQNALSYQKKEGGVVDEPRGENGLRPVQAQTIPALVRGA